MSSEELVFWLLEQGFDCVPSGTLCFSSEDLAGVECLILNGHSKDALLLAKALISRVGVLS